MSHFQTSRIYTTTVQGFTITAEVRPMGNDLLVTLEGGASHIGAVAMATPRPSLSNPKRTSASTSVHCYLGHKDDEPARKLAGRLAAAMHTNVVVVAGMHWDDLQIQDLETIETALDKLTETVLRGESSINHTRERT